MADTNKRAGLYNTYDATSQNLVKLPPRDSTAVNVKKQAQALVPTSTLVHNFRLGALACCMDIALIEQTRHQLQQKH